MVKFPDGSTRPIAAVELPEMVDEQIQSWHCAFKDLATSDYVVGQAWARIGADRLPLDQTRARMDCLATVQAVRELSQKWPYTYAKLIEDKANGSAVVQMLQHQIPGIIPVNPEGGKVARASAMSPQLEAGNVYLPHPQFAPWVLDFIEECAAFPKGKNDDQVDAASQALNGWNMMPEEEIILIYDDPVEISRY